MLARLPMRLDPWFDDVVRSLHAALGTERVADFAPGATVSATVHTTSTPSRRAAAGPTPGVAIRALRIAPDHTGWSLECEVPGYDPSAVQVEVTERHLIIRAGKGPSAAADAPNTQASDATDHPANAAPAWPARPAMEWEVGLPSDADVDGIEAALRHGLLRVKVPRVRTAPPRRIAITP